MKHQFPGTSAGKKTEKGLTTIELLISMAIFLVVVSSVYGILKIGNMSRSTINTRSENIKNVRMAVNYIGREAVNAGLGYNRIGGIVPDNFTAINFGLPADPDTDYDILTAISTGSNISGSKLSKNSEKNDVVAFAFRDFQFNSGLPVVVTDADDTSADLILKTPDGACSSCRPYDLFLVETGDGKQAMVLSTNIINNNQIVLGDDPLNINYGQTSSGSGGTSGGSGGGLLGSILTAILGGGTKKDNSILKKCTTSVKTNCINYPTTKVTVKKIYLVSYNVDNEGTLIRTTYGNNTGGAADKQILKQPVANGVRSFKLQYLLSDGTVSADPSEANTKKEKCNDTIQIEVTVTVESETNQNGIITTDPIVLSSTFSTRNLKYDSY